MPSAKPVETAMVPKDVLRGLSVSAVHEAMNPISRIQNLMNGSIKPINPKSRICGFAKTALCAPNDGLYVHRAVEAAAPGDVLVFSSGPWGRTTMCGELIAVFAQSKGVEGCIIDGNIRDSSRIVELDFPVWSSGIGAMHGEKRGPGAIDVPIVCGGVVVRPGDLVVADADGVVVVPASEVAETIGRAQERSRREEVIKRKFSGPATPGSLLSENIFNPREVGEQR